MVGIEMSLAATATDVISVRIFYMTCEPADRLSGFDDADVWPQFCSKPCLVPVAAD